MSETRVRPVTVEDLREAIRASEETDAGLEEGLRVPERPWLPSARAFDVLACARALAANRAGRELLKARLAELEGARAGAAVTRG